MKSNKLTPGSNLMWESSRMMLPEHRHRIQEHQDDIHKKEKPILDEQQIEQCSQRIAEALVNNLDVTITLFHPFNDKLLSGKIVKVDLLSGRIKLLNQDDVSWIKWEDIINVTFATN